MIGKGSSNVAQQASAQYGVVPAPIRGMDARIGAAANDDQICLWAINIMPVEYGMRVRQGYRELQTGIPSEVRTIVPYEGLVSTGADDKIFSVCAEGIYDTTAPGGVPVEKFAFSNVTEDSGWGNYTHYIDEAGNDFIFYADGDNGLFTYTPSTDTWAQATGLVPSPDSIGTFDVTDIVYIVVHKLRIWFITKNSNKAWYLNVRASTGECTEFFFGNKFKHGGDLVGLYNWTIDGGAGRDDHLVAISRGGDVLPYTGDDPSSDMTWENTGVYFIGRVPRGTRVASEYGGSLFLLSAYGITAMADLVSGLEPEDPNKSQLGNKVARLVRLDMRDYYNLHGWAIKFVSDQGMLVVNTPKRADDTYRQYVMNTTTYGWGLWRDIPYVCAEPFDGDLLIGDPDGRLLRMDRDVDNVPTTGGTGDDIRWFVLTSFNDLGSPAINKRCKFIRPNFSVSEGASPTFDAYAMYNYLTLEPLAPVTGPGINTGDVWDTGLWDEARWSSTVQLPFFATHGAWGIGRTFAIAMTGRSRGQTLLASWDIAWDVGGFL